MTVSSEDTIDVVKALIQQKENIPREQQRLSFDCTELEPGVMLKDYNIQKNSTIYLMLRISGGAKGPATKKEIVATKVAKSRFNFTESKKEAELATPAAVALADAIAVDVKFTSTKIAGLSFERATKLKNELEPLRTFTIPRVAGAIGHVVVPELEAIRSQCEILKASEKLIFTAPQRVVCLNVFVGLSFSFYIKIVLYGLPLEPHGGVLHWGHFPTV